MSDGHDARPGSRALAEALVPKPGAPDLPLSPRLEWLDVMRLLCALEIVGFHWLRASHRVGLFGRPDQPSLVDAFWGDNGRGLAGLKLVLVAGPHLNLGALVGNLFGLLFGFGWQAVNVFALLSGLTLALHFRPGSAGLRAWYLRRATRILIPYYAASLPLLLAAMSFAAAFSGHAGKLGEIAAKTGSQINGPWYQSLFAHIVLFDPFARQGVYLFFAPAWWFVPAILVAYACFPALFKVLLALGRIATLGLALLVSLTAYRLVQEGVLILNAWYFVILNEAFTFTLGIVAGRALLDPVRRDEMLRFASGRHMLPLGMLLFLAGNLANLFHTTYFAASAGYSTGLTLMLAFLSLRLCRVTWLTRFSARVDVYKVYLLHQPLAFPLAVLGGAVLGRAALAAGFVTYLVAIAFAVTLFGFVLDQVLFRRRSMRIKAPGVQRA